MPTDDLSELQRNKLAEEVRQLRRPFYAKSTFWFGVVTTACAVGGLAVQLLTQQPSTSDSQVVAEDMEALVRELRSFRCEPEVNAAEGTVPAVSIGEDSDLSQTERIGEILSALNTGYGMTFLSLSGTRIDDLAVRKLKVGQMKRLKTLDLSSTGITDAALAGLVELAEVEQLLLLETAISNRGLAYVSKLKALRQLSISPARDLPKEQRLIDDYGLRHLSQLTDLRVLRVRNRKGSVLENLRLLNPDASNLETHNYSITDEGLKYFAALQRLETLDLTGSQVTRAGRDELQAKLPQLEHFRPLFSLPNSIRIGAGRSLPIRIATE